MDFFAVKKAWGDFQETRKKKVHEALIELTREAIEAAPSLEDPAASSRTIALAHRDKVLEASLPLVEMGRVLSAAGLRWLADLIAGGKVG